MLTVKQVGRCLCRCVMDPPCLQNVCHTQLQSFIARVISCILVCTYIASQNPSMCLFTNVYGQSQKCFHVCSYKMFFRVFSRVVFQVLIAGVEILSCVLTNVYSQSQKFLHVCSHVSFTLQNSNLTNYLRNVTMSLRECHLHLYVNDREIRSKSVS